MAGEVTNQRPKTPAEFLEGCSPIFDTLRIENRRKPTNFPTNIGIPLVENDFTDMRYCGNKFH
jgi:hypothetical protein